MKKYRVLLSVLFVALALGSACSMAVAARIPLVIDYFETEKVTLEERYRYGDSVGILLQSQESGSYVSPKHTATGEFSAVVRTVADGTDIFSIRFVDPESSGEFRLSVQKGAGSYSAYVVISGKKGGLFYTSDMRNDSGLTNLRNENGIFTALGRTDTFRIDFDPDEGSVKVNDTLIWNVYSDYCDGRYIPSQKTFNSYDVTFMFERQTGRSEILLTEYCGHLFERADMVDQTAPALSVPFEYNGLAGEDYYMPEPYVFDFVDGRIDDVSVAVKDGAGSVVYQGKYEESPLRLQAGTYTAEYTVSDRAGNSAGRAYDFRVLNSQKTAYEFSCDVPRSEDMGQYARLTLPAAVIGSDLFTAGWKTASLSVLCNGAACGFSGVSADTERAMTLNSVGTYSFIYADENNPLIDAYELTVTADADIVAFNLPSVTGLARGDVFTVPDVTVNKGEKTFSAKYTVTTPDGGVYTNRQYELTEAGVYTVTYTAEIEEQLYVRELSFSVHDKSERMFTASQATVTYKSSALHSSLIGLEVESNGAGVIEFNRLIDVENLTKDNLLIDFIVTPSVPDTAEFSIVNVTLTDSADSENALVFRARDCENDSYQRTYIQGKAPGQTSAGWSYEFNCMQNVDRSGTVVYHSFNATADTFYYPTYNNSVKYYYDNEERALYTQTDAGKVLCADFDNPEHFASKWSGFKSDKVKLSVSVAGVVTKAHYMIKSVLGYDFSNEYLTETAPDILVDVPVSVPQAEKGVGYKLFGYDVRGNAGIAESGVRVYFKELDYRIEVPVKDGSFTPFIAGDYIAEYYAVDYYGRTTAETIAITAFDDVPPPEIILSGNVSGDVRVGGSVNVRGYTASGPNVVRVDVAVTHNGSEVALNDMSFKPLASGEYEVTYTVYDYIGQSCEVTDTIVVPEYDNKPVLTDAGRLPPVFVSGTKYTLPVQKGLWYSGGQEINVTAFPEVRINGMVCPVGSDGSWTPSVSENSVCEVIYNFSEGAGLTERYEVPVVAVRYGKSGFMADLFVSEGYSDVTATLLNGIRFVMPQEDNSVTFARPLSARNFTMKFQLAKADSASLGGVRIRLTDVDDKSVSVVLDIDRDSYVSVSGDTRKVLMAGAVNGGTFTVSFSNNTLNFTDGDGTRIASASVCENGRPFYGFPGGAVYAEIEVYGTDGGDVTLSMLELNNQSLSNMARDSLPPVVEVSEDLGGTISVGEKITLSPAKAYDVLSDISSFTVTVYDLNSGAVIKDDAGNELRDADAQTQYTFTVTSSGTIVVRYNVTDSSGQSFSTEKNYYMPDTEPPVITVSGSVPKTGTVGKELILPSFTASDAQGEIINSYIAVTLPTGRFVTVNAQDGKYRFTPTESGRYVIRYVAFDESYNQAAVTFELNV